MTSIISVLIAVVAFAFANVIIAHKLSGFSPLVVIPLYSFFVAITTFGIGGWAKAMGHSMPLPDSTGLWWLLVIGIIFVVGDIAYIGAYGMKGASLSTITTCIALVPVLAMLIDKFCFQGTFPSMRTLLGFALAIFTVWLVAFDPANIPIKH